MPKHILLILPSVEDKDKKIKKLAIHTTHVLLKKQKPGMESYNEKLLPVFLLIKEDTDKSIRLGALQTLVNILDTYPNEMAIVPLLKDVQHEDKKIRLEVIKALSHFKQKEKVRHVLKLLMTVDEDTAVQQLAEEKLKIVKDNKYLSIVKNIRNYLKK